MRCRTGRRVVMGLLVLCVALPGRAEELSSGAGPRGETRAEILLQQRLEKAKHLRPYEVSRWELRVRGWEKAKFPQNIFIKGWRGLRPLLGGMPSGSGLVFGAGYIRGLENQYFQFQANARYSTKGYTTADAELVYPPPQEHRRFEVKARTELRDLTSLEFFGLGNGSSRDDRSTYRLNDRSATTHLWLNPRGLLSFGAQLGWYGVKTRAGSDEPSLETVFDPRGVAGFRMPRRDFAVAGGWVELDIRDKWEEPPVGVVARVTTLRFQDTSDHRFDFTRWIADVKGYIPLGYRSRILAVRFRTSHSDRDGDAVIPFYMMETLGGARTLRGFDEYRFRDRRNLLLQIEYRWEIWAYTDMTVFVDAGKVFSDLGDFNFKDLHTGYGFGLRVHAPGGWRLRFDAARSTEGFRFHVGGGPTF